jgi:hypothetical protein
MHMVFRRRNPIAGADRVIALESQASALVAGLRDSSRRLAKTWLSDQFRQLSDFLLDLARDWLVEAGDAYRRGGDPELSLKKAAQAIQMADGLMQVCDFSLLAALAGRITNIADRITKADAEGIDASAVKLSRELNAAAIEIVREAFEDLKKSDIPLLECHIQKAFTATDRAEEALESGSAGVRLVAILDALKP